MGQWLDEARNEAATAFDEAEAGFVNGPTKFPNTPWMLMSWAAFKGLWQLIFNPFYWEKTHHGLTSFTTTSEISEASLEPKTAGENR